MNIRTFALIFFIGVVALLRPLQAREPLILDDGLTFYWSNGTVFEVNFNNNVANIRGQVGEASAGIVRQVKIDIKEARQIVIEVKGTDRNTFTNSRLLKLEVDRKTLMSKGDRVDVDPQYVRARDGAFLFPIPDEIVENGFISKLQIVFWRCNLANGLELSVWLE